RRGSSHRGGPTNLGKVNSLAGLQQRATRAGSWPNDLSLSFAAPSNSSPPRRSDNAVQKISERGRSRASMRRRSRIFAIGSRRIIVGVPHLQVRPAAARRERPCNGRAAEQGDKLASSHVEHGAHQGITCHSIIAAEDRSDDADALPAVEAHWLNLVGRIRTYCLGEPN